MATADNLKIAQQLLATMQQITAQVERQTEAYHAQAQLVDALCKAQECFGKIDADKVREVTNALKEAQEKTKEFGTELANTAEKEAGKLEGAIGEIAEKIKKLSVPGEFLNGFKSGLSLSTNLFKNILSLGGTAFGLLKDIAGIFLSLPGKLMDFFQGAASGGSDPYRQALEDLRGEFGDLEVGTSAAIKNMTESTKKLGESGLALSRVFGHGREGLANMLKDNMDMFKQMGPLANRLAESLRGAEGEFTLLRKATGLTGEAMKAFQLRAEETGMSGAQATREMTLALAQGQRAFGISVKEFGRDIEVMLKDTITFGIKAPAEMVKVSAYVKKLGISMETLKKVTDKAFNFEDAAQQAAKLSEAFGIALDPLKQMEADPVKKMDNLRQALFKSGQRYETMSAQARKYLSETAGISDEEARIAFSQKNRALTGAQVEAQMKKQQKAQMSQAEAMQILARSVQRLVKSGEPLKGSFFDIFAKGFESGIRRSREFREVVRNLQKSMRIVYLAGRDVGRMFVKEFPGIKDILKGLADMFNPRRFRGLMYLIVGEFRNFFKTLQTDPRAGVIQFMKNMKIIFFDFFLKGTPAGARLIDGFKTFFKTIGMIFVEGIKQALKGLKDLLTFIIAVIKNPAYFSSSAAGALGEGLTGMFIEAFQYLATELGPILRELGPIIVRLFETVFEEYIQPHLGRILLGALAFFLGPAIILGFVRAGTALLLQGLVGILTNSSRTVNNIASGVTQVTRTTGPGGVITETSLSRKTEDLKGVGVGLLKLAGTLAIVGLAAYAAVRGIINLAKIYEESGIKRESFLAVGAMFGLIALVMTGIAMAIPAIRLGGEALKGGGGGSVAAGLLAMTATLIVIIAATEELISLSNAVGDAQKLLAVGEVLKTITVVFGLTGILLVEAGVLGGLIGATGGLGAIAAGAGMAAIATAVVGIGRTTKTIVDMFAGIPESQARAAAITIEKVTDLYRVVAGMLRNILLYSFIMRSSRAATDIVYQLSALVNIIATKAAEMIASLEVENLSSMQAKASILNSIMTGMAAMLTPLSNLGRAFAENAMFLTEDTFTRFSTTVTRIIQILQTSLSTIFQGIERLLSNIRDVTVLKTAAEALSAALQGIGAFLTTIMQLFGERTEGVGSSALSGVVGGALLGPGGAAIGGLILGAIRYFSNMSEFEQKIDALIRIFNVVIPKLIELINGVTPSLRSLLSIQIGDNTLKALQGLSPIVSTITSSLTSLSTISTNLKGMSGTDIAKIVESASKLISEVMPRMGTLMTNLGEFVDKMLRAITGINVSPAQLKVFESVVTIFNVVSNTLTSFSRIAENALRNATGPSSEITRIITSGANFLRSALEVLPQFVTLIGSNIQPLLDVIGNLRMPSGLARKIKSVKSLFDLVPPIVTAYGEFVNITKNMPGSDARDPKQTSGQILTRLLNQIRTLMEFISPAAATTERSFPELLQELITNVSNLNFGGDIRQFVVKVNALKQAFEAIKSIVEVVKALQDIRVGQNQNNKPLRPDVLNVPLVSLSNVLLSLNSKFISDKGVNSENPLKNMKLFEDAGEIKTNLDRVGAVTKLTSLKNIMVSIFAAANEIVNAAANIVAPEDRNSRSLDLRLGLASLQSVLKVLSMPRLLPDNIANPLHFGESDSLRRAMSVSDGLTSLNPAPKLVALKNSIRDIAAALNGLPETLEGIRQPDIQKISGIFNSYFNPTVGLMSILQGYFGDKENINSNVVTLTNNIRERALAPIRGMVTAYNDFIAEVQSLSSGDAPLQVALTALGTTLGGRQTLAVRNAAVNAQINVQVNIEARQLVSALEVQSRQTTTTNTPRLQTSSFVRAPNTPNG